MFWGSCLKLSFPEVQISTLCLFSAHFGNFWPRFTHSFQAFSFRPAYIPGIKNFMTTHQMAFHFSFVQFPFQPEPPKQHCLGIKCENWAKPGAIYCSTRCIVSHCRDALKLLEEEKEKATGGSKHHEPHRRDSFGDALTPVRYNVMVACRKTYRIVANFSVIRKTRKNHRNWKQNGKHRKS